jgi:hypothetical protein
LHLMLEFYLIEHFKLCVCKFQTKIRNINLGDGKGRKYKREENKKNIHYKNKYI